MTVFNFTLPANVTVQLISDSVEFITAEEFAVLSTFNPGIERYDGDICEPVIKITHTESDAFSFTQRKTHIDIHDTWNGKLSEDFPHLLYGCARLAWLERGIFPVHSACVGDDASGYTLIIGASGSGKSSVSLQSVFYNNLHFYSGDKTLISIDSEGEVHAIAGTKAVEIRERDYDIWENAIESPVIKYADRMLFRLREDQYAATPSVKIKSIALLGLSDLEDRFSEMHFPMSLHALYPYFMDKAREDITIANGKSVFDGSLSQETKEDLTKSLSRAFQTISTHQIRSNREKLAGEIARQINPMPLFRPLTLKSKKILYGVCGIGNGHIFESIPVVNHLLESGHDIIMFGYGASYDYFLQNYPSLSVVRTANPYYVADKEGLNFKLASEHPANQDNLFQINCNAMAYVKERFGRADLVIADYECVSAQYAYGVNSPVLTLEQQSKYLLGDFTEVNGTSSQDEVERLSMFFPKATRFALSFFDVKKGRNSEKDHNVRLFPPILRESITRRLGDKKSEDVSILVYMTAWQDTEQSLDELYAILKLQETTNFHIFLPHRIPELPQNVQNLNFYHHGDSSFDAFFQAVMV